MAKKVVAEGLSVRQVEDLASRSSENKKKPISKRKVPLEVQIAENELTRLLGTKVSLKDKGSQGKIEIQYYSREELERLLEVFQGIV